MRDGSEEEHSSNGVMLDGHLAGDGDGQHSEDGSDFPEDDAEDGLDSVERMLGDLHKHHHTLDDDTQRLLDAVRQLLDQASGHDVCQSRLDVAEIRQTEEKEEQLREELSSQERQLQEASVCKMREKDESARIQQECGAVLEECQKEVQRLHMARERSTEAKKELGRRQAEVEALRDELRTQEKLHRASFFEFRERLGRSRLRQEDIELLSADQPEMDRKLDQVEIWANGSSRDVDVLHKQLLGRPGCSSIPITPRTPRISITPRTAVKTSAACQDAALAMEASSTSSASLAKDPGDVVSPGLLQARAPGSPEVSSRSPQPVLSPSLRDLRTFTLEAPDDAGDHRVTRLRTELPATSAWVQPANGLCGLGTYEVPGASSGHRVSRIQSELPHVMGSSDSMAQLYGDSSWAEAPGAAAACERPGSQQPRITRFQSEMPQTMGRFDSVSDLYGDTSWDEVNKTRLRECKDAEVSKQYMAMSQAEAEAGVLEEHSPESEMA